MFGYNFVKIFRHLIYTKKKMEPWNDPSVQQPPVYTSSCNTPKDIESLRYICEDMIRVLTNQSPLYKESAIFSRFLYKYDKKFRNDIGFRIFKKVNTSLRRYLSVNFMKTIENFHSHLPSPNCDELYLPSRQMLEYVLIRLMSFSKILSRICTCAKQSAVFYLNRLRKGESHWMSLMPYAVLSRIWSFCKVLLQHSVGWYSKLHMFLNILEYRGMPFLVNNYALPDNLGEWLDIKNLDNIGRYNWHVNKFVQRLSLFNDFAENDEGFDLFKYVQNVNAENENKCYNITEEKDFNNEKEMQQSISNIVNLHNTSQIEQGEVISREMFKSKTLVQENTDSCKQNNVPHSVDKINNVEDLNLFIENEENFRYSDSEKSLTKHLSFMQWQALKLDLLKLHKIVNYKNKFIKKIHKIWKSKCEDYL